MTIVIKSGGHVIGVLNKFTACDHNWHTETGEMHVCLKCRVGRRFDTPPVIDAEFEVIEDAHEAKMDLVRWRREQGE